MFGEYLKICCVSAVATAAGGAGAGAGAGALPPAAFHLRTVLTLLLAVHNGSLWAAQ